VKLKLDRLFAWSQVEIRFLLAAPIALDTPPDPLFWSYPPIMSADAELSNLSAVCLLWSQLHLALAIVVASVSSSFLV
jgi:hypothetical protein